MSAGQLSGALRWYSTWPEKGQPSAGAPPLPSAPPLGSAPPAPPPGAPPAAASAPPEPPAGPPPLGLPPLEPPEASAPPVAVPWPPELAPPDAGGAPSLPPAPLAPSSSEAEPQAKSTQDALMVQKRGASTGEPYHAAARAAWVEIIAIFSQGSNSSSAHFPIWCPRQAPAGRGRKLHEASKPDFDRPLVVSCVRGNQGSP